MPKNWSGKTDGTKGMQHALIVIFKYIDVRVMYGVMAIVILFYMLFQHSTYQAIYRYFRECYQQSAIKAFFNTYRNHYIFGQVILDRFAAYAGRKYKFIIENNELFQEYTKGEDGFIIISSHIGNYEIAGYSISTPNKRMHVLSFAGETETVMENRARMFGQNNIGIIPLKGDLSHVFLIHNALSNGDIVSMPGDRIFGSNKTIECQFFNKPASFPQGPFHTAIAAHKSVLTIFVMKDKWDTYHLYIYPLATEKNEGKSRQQKMEELAQDYASKMEDIVRKYPLQWFHYFNFWEQAQQ